MNQYSQIGCSEQHAQKKPGFFNRLFFFWIYGLLKLGKQRPLTQDDLDPLSEEFKAEILVNRLEETWTQELNSANRQGRRPQLWKAILRVLPMKRYLTAMMLKTIYALMKFALVVIMWLFFKYLQGESHIEKWYPPFIVLGIGICSFVNVFSYHHGDHVTLNMGIQLKVAVIGLVYKKILSLKCSGIKGAKSGTIMNLLSNDAQRMEELVYRVFYSIFGLLSVPVGIALLWGLIGWKSLSGTTVLIPIVICQAILLSYYGRLNYKQKKATDDRLAMVRDIISGIRAVKMYALEWHFIDAVKSLRRKEMKLLRLQSIFAMIPGAQILGLSSIATLVSLTTLFYSEIQFNIVNIFTMVLLYNILCSEVALSFNFDSLLVVNGLVSIKRLEEFFMTSEASWHYEAIEEQDDKSLKTRVIHSCYEFFKKVIRQKHSSKDLKREDHSLLTNNSIDGQKYHSIDGSTELPDTNRNDDQPNVTMMNVSAGWLEDDDQCTLHDISLTARPNQLLMVTGPVGSGKSTLLMAILEEIHIKSGTISTHGRIAYVSQHPWIFTGTVRDNILFGQNFDQNRYQRALDVCNLNRDISHFPKGDLSTTGQRGISLSGGQRVRVSLARAVYSNADIYLLDDPLSALDVKVGQYVLDECICNTLSSRIRILVTHQLQHLHRADEVLIMEYGRLVVQGTHKQLTNDGLIGDFLQSNVMSSNKAEDVEDEMHINYSELITNTGKDMEEEDEDRQVGKVTWQVYWKYLKAGLPSWLIGCFVLFYLAVQGIVLATQLWLSQLSKPKPQEQKGFTHLGILAILAVTGLVLCFTKDYLTYNIFLNASKNLHDKMTIAVLKSPILFFDTNPLGRIFNRFSKDIGCLDNLLPQNIAIAAVLSINALGVVVLTLITNIWFILVVFPLAFLCYLMCRLYMDAARDLKRMEAMQCSPIYEHAAETLTGLEVVRASHMLKNFTQRMFSLEDENTKALCTVVSACQWFSLHNDLVYATFLTSMAGVFLATGEDKALSAMLLTLAVGLVSTAQYALRLLPDIESKMTSVERVLTYTNLPLEPGYSRDIRPPEDWPTNGALSLRNVSLVYFEGGPRVLKDINFDVKPVEKLGIAGRTGAGKSSLVASLFRMPDPEGHVIIDGVDLGTIDLQAARRSMAVITQDPVLFIGSLRKNLDPFNSLTDLQLWTALEEVQLKQKVLCLHGQLEYTIGDGGSGLSAGERQLLCLARALLQKCKILILDEATANIDYETDQLIQQTIRNRFSKCTVLTIAHRLNTIIDYDKVVVLDDGQVVDHDNPRVLAGKPNSIFAQLLKSNLTTEEQK